MISLSHDTLHRDLNIKALPSRAYLDKTVVPLLLQGMTELSKVRYVDYTLAYYSHYPDTCVHTFHFSF
jgi:hypothetical protein